jgi:hypothetical protein
LADFAVAGLAGVYGGLQDRERLVEVVHGLRLYLGRGGLDVEALAQGDGCRYLRCTDGAQLGVEPIRKQRLERQSAGGVVVRRVGQQRHLPDGTL